VPGSTPSSGVSGRLTALDRSEIELPDDEAREALGKAAEGYDEASGYQRVCAVHDAHHALLCLLG